MTKAEKLHKTALARLGCVVCRRVFGITDGPVELHHLRTGGWGRGDYKSLIPVCWPHHRGDIGIHGMGTRGFEKHYGFTQLDLLNDTIRLMKEVS